MSSEPFWIPDGLNQVLSPELDEKITKPTDIIIKLGVDALDDELSQVTMLFEEEPWAMRDKLLSVYKKRLAVNRTSSILPKLIDRIENVVPPFWLDSLIRYGFDVMSVQGVYSEAPVPQVAMQRWNTDLIHEFEDWMEEAAKDRNNPRWRRLHKDERIELAMAIHKYVYGDVLEAIRKGSAYSAASVCDLTSGECLDATAIVDKFIEDNSNKVIRKAINRKIVEEILEELGNHSIRVRNKTYQILI